MDQSCSESDVSLSPSQILERLQVLRQLQLLQRGKLQKQRLQYNETSETSSSITEIVSHFSNSTSYNTFRSLLQSPQNASNDGSPRLSTSGISQKVKERDLLEGVSVLNLSQESEFIVNSPTSMKSTISASSGTALLKTETAEYVNTPPTNKINLLSKKQITLDEMPIISPKKDFETLILEKLKNDKNAPKEKETSKDNIFISQNKKPFLRRGEGMSRFGLKKNDFIVQNTKSLPWRKKSNRTEPVKVLSAIKNSKLSNSRSEKVEVEILVAEQKSPLVLTKQATLLSKATKMMKPKLLMDTLEENNKKQTTETIDCSNCDIHSENMPEQKIKELPRGKDPSVAKNGKTWAAVLTKEQNDFLRQLKQSDYYKNFASPAKSTVSDISCDENLLQLRHEREQVEQNMFEFLENKVSHESFNLENSFFHRFLRKGNYDYSSESTPLIMQKCLANNPGLLHIFSDVNHTHRNENSHSDAETCQSEYTECCSDACSSVSSCCSCKTVEATNITTPSCIELKENKHKIIEQKSKINKVYMKKVQKPLENEQCKDDNVKENEVMKANMAEMNAKLVTTSELLKDRLHELEDEIETFRKENINLSKLREEIDQEKQKFYEEKTTFEQKFNEEKILSEYYLAEEKDKLTKQKQMYERYVREMRGRLNKKDKDEVTNLKQEVNNLKEEIRSKDAKSTSTIARLRNHIKIMEKEKKDLQVELEKLKKENKRIQHSNDITRRLTNMKYLEEINKKLSHMSKETQSEVHLDNDVKYKAFEIERQSRSKKVQPRVKNVIRPRAKSVPNLNITSRYAKYFSQRDAVSQMERNKTLHIEKPCTYIYGSDNEKLEDSIENYNSDTNSIHDNLSDTEENNLEKIYIETFQSNSSKTNRSSLSNSGFNHTLEKEDLKRNNDFFIRKSISNSANITKSPMPTSLSPHLHNSYGSSINRSKSPISILSNRSSGHRSPNNSAEFVANISGGGDNTCKSKSPMLIFSNHTLQSQRSATVIPKDVYRDELAVISPEPTSSKTSLTKTNLNPTEIRRPDGTRELRFPNGNIKYISADEKYSKFVYYNGDVKENFYNEGRIKYFYAETKTNHTTHPDGLEVLEFPDGQVEKRYKDGSSEIRLPNGSIRYFDPKNEHVREEWRFPDGAALTVSADGERRIVFGNGQVEVHAEDHKRREFPDGTVKLVYNDGTSETRYASGRVRIKDKHGNLIMDSASGS